MGLAGAETTRAKRGPKRARETNMLDAQPHRINRGTDRQTLSQVGLRGLSITAEPIDNPRKSRNRSPRLSCLRNLRSLNAPKCRTLMRQRASRTSISPRPDHRRQQSRKEQQKAHRRHPYANSLNASRTGWVKHPKTADSRSGVTRRA
jgi:hypothetical protein